MKCSLSRDAAQSRDNVFLQTATLDIADADCAEALLLHGDGAVFMGRRLTVVDAASEGSSSSTKPSAPDPKTYAKARAACDLLPTATPDQLRDIMALLCRLSQTDADHVRQVLLGNPALSLALACAAERLQLLDQPLKHLQAPAPAAHHSNVDAAGGAAAAAAAGAAAASGAHRQPPGSSGPPPPPPVNLPIEVQQALEMLLREYAPTPLTSTLFCCI